MLYSNEFYQHKKDLFHYIQVRGVQNNQKVKLSSGKISNFYINCKPVILTSYGHKIIGSLFSEIIFSHLDKYPIVTYNVAGVELGGCALASATSSISDMGLDALYIRKKKKDYGSQKLIEGQIPSGGGVVLLEDVITTGQSVINALEQIYLEGLTPVHIIALVDREEGGVANIKKFAADKGWGSDKYSFITCLYHKSHFAHIESV